MEEGLAHIKGEKGSSLTEWPTQFRESLKGHRHMKQDMKEKEYDEKRHKLEPAMVQISVDSDI